MNTVPCYYRVTVGDRTQELPEVNVDTNDPSEQVCEQLHDAWVQSALDVFEDDDGAEGATSKLYKLQRVSGFNKLNYI